LQIDRVAGFGAGHKILLLCLDMAPVILGMHLYPIFNVLLLKMLLKGLSTGKAFSLNSFPMLFFTFREKGG